MKMTDKQDRYGARTPADLEREYRFGKNFAEARQSAEKAAADVLALESKVKTLENRIAALESMLANS